MATRSLLIFVMTVVAAPVATSYEWRSHNQMAFDGRDIFLGQKASHRPPYPVDERLLAFLAGLGEDIDTRAGNACDVNQNPTCPSTDEDHIEGLLTRAMWCIYYERPCTPPFSCTFDHFSPELPLPLGEEDAQVHARKYFEMAVKLYKASVCPTPLADEYRKGAARALGHVIHLVEDMGSPQHVRPENHLDFPLGHGPSFHEYWSLDVWNDVQQYTEPRGDRTWEVGRLEDAAAQAHDPLRAGLEVVMSNLADQSRNFIAGSTYAPGTTLLFGRIQEILAESRIVPWWGFPGGMCPPLTLCAFSARQSPYFYTPHDGDSGKSERTHIFASQLWPISDYSTAPTLRLEDAPVTIKSYELAERLDAEPEIRNPLAAVAFDVRLKDLIAQTTNGAAGVILAFWDEVKDFQCDCPHASPCEMPGLSASPSYRAGTLVAGSSASTPKLSCTPPSPSPPYSPGRDYPDDNAGVVGTTANTPTAPGPVGSYDAVDRAKQWRRIAAVGIEKNITELADYGDTMWLLETGTEPARRTDELTDDSKLLLARALASMEAKYSADIPRPEESLSRAAHFAVLQSGFSGGVAALLDRFGYTYAAVDVNFDPLGTAEEFPVLIIPSGGLYGTATSGDLRERLGSYAEAGGTIVSLAQMHGADYGSLPTPQSEALHGFGWFEDQSCWRDSVRVARAHPVTSSARTLVLSIPVDGFFDQWPGGSEILLSRTSGGTAAMLTYRLGEGRVVVASTFEDWAESNGTGTLDGTELMANLLHWTRQPEAERPACALVEACNPSPTVTLHNMGDTPTDVVEWTIADTLGVSPANGSWRQALALGPGARADIPVPVALPPRDRPFLRPGIYRLSYRLLDSTRELTRVYAEPIPWQAQASSEAGQVIFHAWPDEIPVLPELALGLAVDSEYVLPYSSIPVHISVRNAGREVFQGRARLSYAAPAMFGFQPLGEVAVLVPPGRLQLIDTTVGPLILQPGHDGLPGGAALRAELTGPEGGDPLLTVHKNVVTNVKDLSTTFQASEEQAGPGDLVTYGGRLANASQGSLNLRYRLVHENTLNVLGSARDEIRSDWRTLTLQRDEVTDFAEPFVVPNGWQGLVRTQLVLCLEEQPCWASGDDRQAAWFRAYAEVAVPMSHVTLDLGEPQPVAGPFFRVPVLVRNTGSQPVVAGQVRLALAGSNEATAISEPFDLPRGEERELTFDLPFTAPGASGPGAWRITADFTDRLWRARSEQYPWTFAVSAPLRYDARVGTVTSIQALAGTDTIRGTVVLENRSTFGRAFTTRISCPALGFEETRQVDVGAAQSLPFEVAIPLPAGQPYGLFPVSFHADDGFLLAIDRQLLAAYADAGPLISSRTEGELREGETIQLIVRLQPSNAGGAIPGTLAVVCAQPPLDEVRELTLEPGQPSDQAYLIQLPSGNAGGQYSCAIEWQEPNGHTASAQALFVVPAAEFTARLTDTEAEAGGELVYDVGNRGGSSGLLQATWTLRDGDGIVGQATAEITLAPDAADQLSFALPASLRSGQYQSRLSFLQPGFRYPAEIPDVVDVTGVAAVLSVDTAKEVYHLGEPMDGWGDITNGPLPLAGATLQLEVVAHSDRVGCAPPWGLFQQNSGRTGASPVGGEIVGHMWFCLMAGVISTTTSFHAEAAADFDGIGRDSVVALEEDAGGNGALSIYSSPLYRWERVRSVPFPGPLDPSELAIADADHDGQLEIFLASFAADGSFVLRAHRPDLTQIWELTEPVAGDRGMPFPGGSPIPVDVDGDGIDEIVASTGRDLLVVRSDTATVAWRLSERTDLSGWQVAGVAAGDLDGDGPPELSLGLRADGGGGRILCLEHDGTIRWQADTTHPVAGAPVHVVAHIPVPSVVYVDTPADQTVSSTLTVRRASDGQLQLETATPFWSSFQPAAADVTGDGLAEFVVASGVRGCETCGLRGPLVFSQSGAVVWSGHDSATGPPVLIDSDVDGVPDVAMPNDPGYPDEQGMWVWRGTDGVILASYGVGLILERRPLRVLIPYGDCAPHFLAGNRTVFGSVEFGAPARPPAGPMLAVDGDVVWSWEGPVELAAGAETRLAQTFDTQGQTGLFSFVGTLRNEQRRTLARAETTFSVTRSDLELAIDPLAREVRLGADAALSGRLRNVGVTPVSVTLRIAISNAPSTERTFSLPPGGEQPFSQPLPTTLSGTRAVKVEVLEGDRLLASAGLRYEVASPDVEATVFHAKIANPELTPFAVHVKNSRTFPTDISVSLDVVDQNPSAPVALHLGPDESADVIFMETFYRTNRLILRIRGDVNRDIWESIGLNWPPTIELASPPIFPAGASAIRLRAHSDTAELFVGQLSWRVDTVPPCSGVIDLRLAPDETVELGLPVDLPAGHFVLSAEVGTRQVSFPLDTYFGGRGTLAVTLPDRVVEGLVEVPIEIANLLDATGTFSLHAEVFRQPSGEAAAVLDRTWVIAASGRLVDSFPVTLPPGDYRLMGWLNSDSEPAVDRSFTATPRVSVELDAVFGGLLPDGTLPVNVTITNASAQAVSATLSLSGIGPAVLAPVAIAGGATESLVVPLHLDTLPGGSLPLSLVLLDGTGLVLAQRTVTFEVLPAALQLASPPSLIEGTAGGTARLVLSVANAGHQSAPVELLAGLGNGAVAAGSRAVKIGGLSSVDVDLPLPLPADLAGGLLPGRYLLLSQRTGPESIFTVAEGPFTVSVAALPLDVEARLDRDHADAGESVELTLEASSFGTRDPVPAFVTVGYGAFHERRDITLSTVPTTLAFSVPIDQPGRAVAYGVYAPSGRALHLNQLAVWPRTGDVVIAGDKTEYRPGDVVLLTVSLAADGPFEAVGFEQQRTLETSGTVDFVIPTSTPQGRYPVAWTFFRPGPDGPVNGVFTVSVRGPSVRLTDIVPGMSRAMAGQTVAVEVEALSDGDLSGLLNAWLRTPSGESSLETSVPVSMAAGRPERWTVDVPVDTREAGTHAIVIAIQASDDTILADGAANLDVGLGRALGLAVGPSERGGSLSAFLVSQGHGDALVVLTLDGRPLPTSHIKLDGITRSELPLPALDAGIHQLRADLTAGGLASSASTDFRVDAPPSACVAFQASPALVWPPDFSLVPIGLVGPDSAGPRPPGFEILSVAQDEPLGPPPQTDAAADATLSPLRVRAERADSGDGRVYHVAFRLTQNDGTSCSGEVIVCVPLAPGTPCVDGGGLFDSTGP